MEQQNQALAVDTVGATPDDQRADLLRQFERGLAGADARRRLEWQLLEDAWLDAKRSLSSSDYTRTSYRRALTAWKVFLTGQFVEVAGGGQRTVELWEVDHSHVRAWVAALGDGRSPATINHYLACVSSFYSYVIDEKRFVNGVEIDLFVDRYGRSRVNPFRTGNIRRAVAHSERARPLYPDEYDRLLCGLERRAETLGGSRNYALILTYLHTGWRSSELLRMRWGDVRPSRAQVGTMIYAWRGKGGKRQDDVLPADCWQAILAFLRKAGRYAPGALEPQAQDAIWRPVAAPNMAGLGAVVDPLAPIGDKSALRILRRAAVLAGIECAESLRIHDLRHTHARLQVVTGANLVAIKEQMHHSNLTTTDRYVRTVLRGDPLDGHSARFRQLRLGVG